MTFDPQRHHRQSIRLPGYDYAQPAAYFVTVVTQGRERLLGRSENGEVQLSDAGRMVDACWHELGHFETVEADAFIVMPNHVYGVLVLREARGGHAGPPLPAIIRGFKSMTTNAYIKGVKEHGWQPFDRRFWQRGYYEHVIRDEEDLRRVREYIVSNPARWHDDPENLNAQGRP